MGRVYPHEEVPYMDAVLRRAERMSAYQNIQFILAHQNDTLEQLTAYLSACTDKL